MGEQAFDRTLVPVRPDVLERGDTVYERVKWGQRPEDWKLQRLRVRQTVRAAARCEFTEGSRAGETVMIPFGKLLMEPRADQTQTRVKLVRGSKSEPPPAAAPAPAAVAPVPKPEPQRPPRVDSGQDFDALVEMGRDVLGKIEREESQLKGERAKVAHDVELIDANHRAHIEALEAELVAARRAGEEDRAFAAARMQSIEGRLAQLERRRQLLAALEEPAA